MEAEAKYQAAAEEEQVEEIKKWKTGEAGAESDAPAAAKHAGSAATSVGRCRLTLRNPS